MPCARKVPGGPDSTLCFRTGCRSVVATGRCPNSIEFARVLHPPGAELCAGCIKLAKIWLFFGFSDGVQSAPSLRRGATARSWLCPRRHRSNFQSHRGPTASRHSGAVREVLRLIFATSIVTFTHTARALSVLAFRLVIVPVNPQTRGSGGSNMEES
jgi:hypothetical protein